MDLTQLSVELQCILLFVLQTSFIYFRVININHSVHSDMKTNIFSSTIFAALFLVTNVMGISAVLSSNVPIIISFFLGGAAGTALSIRRRDKKKAKELKNIKNNQ